MCPPSTCVLTSLLETGRMRIAKSNSPSKPARENWFAERTLRPKNSLLISLEFMPPVRESCLAERTLRPTNSFLISAEFTNSSPDVLRIQISNVLMNLPCYIKQLPKYKTTAIFRGGLVVRKCITPSFLLLPRLPLRPQLVLLSLHPQRFRRLLSLLR